MATFRSFKDYSHALESLKLSPRDLREISKAMSEPAENTARRVAAGDLGGDAKFSGWDRPLDTRTRRAGPTGFILTPLRRSAGPWTVAESGRNADGGVGLFQGPSIGVTTGRTRRKKDGSVATSRNRRSRKRWNGRTSGKGTASRAVREFEKDAKQAAEGAINKHFRRSRVDVD